MSSKSKLQPLKIATIIHPKSIKYCFCFVSIAFKNNSTLKIYQYKFTSVDKGLFKSNKLDI